MDSDEQIFRDALDLLRKDGWCKNNLHQPTGERCAYGALLDVQEGRAFDLMCDLGDVASDLFPIRAGFISGFSGRGRMSGGALQVNNHPDTTFEDIEVIFEKAAIRAAEQI